ncbi:MAG: hypothetical protein IPK26_20400 [Planctomycetes bacterium]|nr:hypothetical protein [Planctomycetota bacterium]
MTGLDRCWSEPWPPMCSPPPMCTPPPTWDLPPMCSPAPVCQDPGVPPPPLPTPTPPALIPPAPLPVPAGGGSGVSVPPLEWISQAQSFYATEAAQAYAQHNYLGGAGLDLLGGLIGGNETWGQVLSGAGLAVGATAATAALVAGTATGVVPALLATVVLVNRAQGLLAFGGSLGEALQAPTAYHWFKAAGDGVFAALGMRVSSASSYQQMITANASGWMQSVTNAGRALTLQSEAESLGLPQAVARFSHYVDARLADAAVHSVLHQQLVGLLRFEQYVDNAITGGNILWNALTKPPNVTQAGAGGGATGAAGRGSGDSGSSPPGGPSGGGGGGGGGGGPPPPPAPAVGGILFDRCADVQTDIGCLDGAVWDAERGELVLLGHDGKAGAPRRATLPAMDADLLHVALRAAIARQPIGVSIDPPARFRDRGATPPDGTPMYVSYLGGVAGTLAGAILFEADRLLKVLCQGIDNVTGQRVNVPIPGHRDLFGWRRTAGGDSLGAWHRFWFVIDQVSLRRDRTTGALEFGPVRIRLCTESELAGGAVHAPAADAAFARFLTDHYQDYARVFPILARLQEVAKISALARWLVATGAKLDLDAIALRRPTPVQTPEQTPGMRVHETESGNGGTHTVSFYGGVDLDPAIVEVPDAGAAARWDRAQRQRPARGDRWSFDAADGRGTALVIRLRESERELPAEVDHPVEARSPDDLQQIRRQPLPASVIGEFGPGIGLWQPWRLTVLDDRGKHADVVRSGETSRWSRTIVVHDWTEGGTSRVYTLASGRPDAEAVFHRIVGHDLASAGRCSTDPNDRLEWTGREYRMRRWNGVVRFGADGLLGAIETGGSVVRYVRHDGSLQSIEVDGRVRRAFLSDQGLIRRIRCDDRELVYRYDGSGRLSSVLHGEQLWRRFVRDPEGRLAEIRDGTNRVLLRRIRDDLGTVVVSSAPGGRAILHDAAGTRVEFADGDDGRLFVRGQQGDGGRWEYVFGPDGRLVEVQRTACSPLRIEHDGRGQARAVTEGGRRVGIERDVQGRVTSLQDVLGGIWRPVYSADGCVRTVLGPGGLEYEIQHDKHGMRVVGSDCCLTFRIGRSPRFRFEHGGQVLEAVFDADGRLARYRFGRSPWVKFTSTPEGGCIRRGAARVRVRRVTDDETVVDL